MNGQTDPHWIRELTNRPHQFSHESGVEVTHVEPGRAEGILTVGPDSINPHGKVHGGALATCVTSGSSMEFLRPADGDRITCTAVPKKEGHTLSVIQVELRNSAEALVATGTFTFFMFDRDI